MLSDLGRRVASQEEIRLMTHTNGPFDHSLGRSLLGQSASSWPTNTDISVEQGIDEKDIKGPSTLTMIPN